jgi:hypothetical protein
MRGVRETGATRVTDVRPEWSEQRVTMTEDQRRIGGPVHLAEDRAAVRRVGDGVGEGHLEGSREEEQQPGMLARATAAAGAAVERIKVSFNTVYMHRFAGM